MTPNDTALTPVSNAFSIAWLLCWTGRTGRRTPGGLVTFPTVTSASADRAGAPCVTGLWSDRLGQGSSGPDWPVQALRATVRGRGDGREAGGV